MAKSLVVIEAPGKLKSFRKYLGNKYTILASRGHVADLPEKKIGVDIKKQFTPTYEIMPGKQSTIDEIVKAASKAETIYLMTDSDREGEAIAWHVARYLPKDKEIRRAVTGSLTKKAIEDAIKDSHCIDADKVNSYECRRILDRLCGYKCSFVTKQATGGRSAGRVQSAALRILAEREKEILTFIPHEYWPIEAELLTPRDEKIVAIIKKPKPLDIRSGDDAKKICDRLKKGPVKVTKYDEQEVSQKSFAPFVTSTILQSAAASFGWKSDHTMKVAQRLYEASAITYHRTDSTFIIPDFISGIRSTIQTRYGASYLPDKVNFFGKQKSAQEAHEACRVVDISQETSSTGDDAKLYKMIWKRTVASQMAPMRIKRITAEFTCDKYILGANGSRVLFDGWRKVWDYGSVEEKELAEASVGETVKVIDIKTEKKMTQPPPRYSTTSTIKKLESEGIGRPSTYASILKTLEDRNYVEYNKKNIQVTALGIRVSDFLIASDFCFVDLHFTSDMEEKLDEIAIKKTTKLEVLTEFWNRLKVDLTKAKEEKDKASKTDIDCPQCKKGKLMSKYSNFGPFFVCERAKDEDDPCDFKANQGDDGKPEKKKEKVYGPDPCPDCKEKMIQRESRYGKFFGCSKFPKCKGMRDLEGEVIVPKKKKGKKGKS
tara:strand:+ start:1711 stop:3687 length:1977 start_codon:yes stop_codon:yes gene_type:complete